jgi:hypothetical protein
MSRAMVVVLALGLSACARPGGPDATLPSYCAALGYDECTPAAILPEPQCPPDDASADETVLFDAFEGAWTELVSDPHVQAAGEAFLDAFLADPRIEEGLRTLDWRSAGLPDVGAVPRVDAGQQPSPAETIVREWFEAMLQSPALVGGAATLLGLGTVAPGLADALETPLVREALEDRLGIRSCSPRFDHGVACLISNGGAERVLGAFVTLLARQPSSRNAFAAFLEDPEFLRVSTDRAAALLASQEFRAGLPAVTAALRSGEPAADIQAELEESPALRMLVEGFRGWWGDVLGLPEAGRRFGAAAEETFRHPDLQAAIAAAIRAPMAGVPIDGPDVAVRLGCDVITELQVRAEAFRTADPELLARGYWSADPAEVAADPERWRGAFARDPAPRLARTEELLVRQAIVRRQAGQLGIVVTDEEVDRAITRIMPANEWDEDDLETMLDDRHEPMDEYRAETAATILQYKVVARAQRPDLQVTEEEVRAEYDRLTEGVGPEGLRPFEEARAGIRRRMIEDRVEEATEAYFARMRRVLESLPVRIENGACIEEWPELPLESLSFAGSRALGARELLDLAASAVGCDGATWTFPDLAWIVDVVKAAYLDLGYVEVAVVDEETPDGGVVLRIDEGDVFHVGAVRVVVRAADGSESEPTDGVAPPLPPVHPAPGELFCRREVNEAMRSLAAEFAALWGVESVGVEPEVEVRDGGVVELTFVVHRP